jgi:hypothetical protein
VNRGRYQTRVRRASVERLVDEFSRTDGACRPRPAVNRVFTERNWRVQRSSRNEVVAIEPGREFETPFYGQGAFWEAVQFAATKLKEYDDTDTPKA